MAYDAGHAELMRGDLADLTGLDEKRMFGGIAFLRHGHMICGVHKDGAMYRVGKAAEAEALALPGARPMAFTGRPMAGFVELGDDGLADDDTRARLSALALAYVATLPPK